MGDKVHNGVYDCNGRWALGRCYVYVLMARDSRGPVYVKIGVSDDPYTRIGGIQTGCPIPLVKAGMVKCRSREQARLIEKELHIELAPFGSSGEWFRFDWSDLSQKQALSAAIETHMSRVKGWVMESIDLAKVFAMKRLVEAHRKNAYRERRRRSKEVKAAVGIG